MKKIQDHALYPGSFDPITCGHIEIISRISPLFAQVTVLVASSIHKKYWFSLKERHEMAQTALQDFSNVRVDKYQGLTTNYLKKYKISVVVRGIRSVSDFPYERDLAINNKKIFPKMETLFLFSGRNTEMVSSKWIKEIAYHKGELKALVPDNVQQKIKVKTNKEIL